MDTTWGRSTCHSSLSNSGASSLVAKLSKTILPSKSWMATTMTNSTAETWETPTRIYCLRNALLALSIKELNLKKELRRRWLHWLTRKDNSAPRHLWKTFTIRMRLKWPVTATSARVYSVSRWIGSQKNTLKRTVGTTAALLSSGLNYSKTSWRSVLS